MSNYLNLWPVEPLYFKRRKALFCHAINQILENRGHQTKQQPAIDRKV
jgi:hypothetical protein